MNMELLESIERDLKDLRQRVERVELFFQIAADEEEAEQRRKLQKSINTRREMWRQQDPVGSHADLILGK